jgi:RimJ/RimL family protein N-acetyltransferase
MLASVMPMEIETPTSRDERDHAEATAPGVVAVGKRVFLRMLDESDGLMLKAWAADPLLKEMVGSELLERFSGGPWPGWLDDLSADLSQINLVIASRRTGRRLGLIRLFNVHRRDGYAFLETMVADSRALKLGYGIEASKLVAYWAVDILKLRRLEAKVYPYNTLSVNTMKRRRWQLEGRLRQAVYHDGEYCDLLVFGILADEINANKADDDWAPVYHSVPDWT